MSLFTLFAIKHDGNLNICVNANTEVVTVAAAVSKMSDDPCTGCKRKTLFSLSLQDNTTPTFLYQLNILQVNEHIGQ